MKNSFKDLTLNELITKRDELKKKYRDLRFNMIIGQSTAKENFKKRTCKSEYDCS